MTGTRFDRILCPVDFSEYSGRALTLALAMGRPAQAQITALSVVPSDVPLVAGDVMYSLPLTPTAARLEEAQRDLEGLVAEHTGSSVRCVVREGDPARCIVEEAEHLGADLIVMGTHGLSGVELLLLGSVTETVLRRAPCPVLTFNSGDALRPVVHELLCPVSLDPQSNHLEHAMALAETWKARLHVLHVLEVDPASARLREEMEAGARRVKDLLVHAPPGVEHTSILTYGDVATEIVRVAEERKADLIVAGVHNRSPLDLLFLGSTTSSVIRIAHCPVLTIRSEYRRWMGSTTSDGVAAPNSDQPGANGC